MGATIFFLVNRFSVINYLYQYSLEFFYKMFFKAIATVRKKALAWEPSLNDEVMAELVATVLRGTLHQH